MKKSIITKSSPTNSTGTLSFRDKKLSRNLKGFTPSEALNVSGVGKIRKNNLPYLRNGAR